MTDLKLYKNKYYTDECIGIYLSYRNKPQLVLKCDILEVGFSKECIFVPNEGRIMFQGIFDDNRDYFSILIPVDEFTLKYYQDNKNKEIEENINFMMSYLTKKYKSCKKYTYLHSTYFYEEFSKQSVLINTIEPSFEYNESNIQENELKVLIEKFNKKYLNEKVYSCNDHMYQYINERELFITKSKQIDYKLMLRVFLRDTKYSLEEIELLLRGLIIHSGYSTLYTNSEAIIEYASHVPKFMSFIEDLLEPKLIDKGALTNKLKNKLINSVYTNNLEDLISFEEVKNEENYLTLKCYFSENNIGKNFNKKVHLFSFNISESNSADFKIFYKQEILHTSINEFILQLNFHKLIKESLKEDLDNYEINKVIKNILNLENINFGRIHYVKRQKENVEFETVVLNDFNKALKSMCLSKYKNIFLKEISVVTNNGDVLNILQSNDLRYKVLFNEKMIFNKIPTLNKEEFEQAIKKILQLLIK